MFHNLFMILELKILTKIVFGGKTAIKMGYICFVEKIPLGLLLRSAFYSERYYSQTKTKQNEPKSRFESGSETEIRKTIFEY